MSMQFEADLDPQNGAPRVRFNFRNGWSVSLVLRMGDQNATSFAMASIAVCPTGRWGQGETTVVDNEATANRFAAIIDELSLRQRPRAGVKS